jgi:enoyl-CoA hydratase/carnithine racemase
MAKSTNWISTLMESKPIIVAIDGAAVGLGATHPLAADIRMMSTSAYFQFPFLKLGSLPELGSSALLQQLVGSGRARELILTGRQLGAEEALHIGLVSAVYETSELFDAALRVADAIACLPREQVRITRQLLNENGRNCDATVALEREAKAFVALARSGGSASPRRRNPTT